MRQAQLTGELELVRMQTRHLAQGFEGWHRDLDFVDVDEGPSEAERWAAAGGGRVPGPADPSRLRQITRTKTGSRILFDPALMTSPPNATVPGCVDTNENCTWWAEIGECVNNPGSVQCCTTVFLFLFVCSERFETAQIALDLFVRDADQL